MRAPSLVVVLAVPALAVVIAGCSKKQSSNGGPAADRQGWVEQQAAKQPPSVAVHLIRARQIQEAQNDLRQIGLFYQTFDGDMGHPPATLEEFTHYIQKDAPSLVKLLNDGTYQLVFMPRGQQRSDSIIAYEKDADVNGRHLVARADATVTMCSSKDLSEILKKK